jgi:hypothetical protein
MDDRRFDDLIRALNSSLNRRRGVAAALGMLFAGTAAAADARNQRDKGNGKGTGGPKAEGPCGDGSRKDNICTKDSDCCTGICNIQTGQTNKDRKGRCRCVKRGKACTADKNCCGGRTCQQGVCAGSNPGPGPGPDPTPTCDAATCPDGCCALGLCVPYTGQTSAGCGTGGAACSACTNGDTCVSGVCTPCSSTTCPNGCCDSTGCVLHENQSDSNCGTSGATCVGCINGDVCIVGVCTPCGPSTCPSGCCNGNTCIDTGSQSDQTCGTNGAACDPCSGGDTCFEGTCTPCGPSTCPAGCCDAFSSTCFPYNLMDEFACGTNGAQCASCDPGAQCISGVCTGGSGGDGGIAG